MSNTLPTQVKSTSALQEGFVPRPMGRMDKAMSLIRSAGIPIPSAENSTVSVGGLAKDLLVFGEADVTAVVRTLNQIQTFNEIVRNNLDQASSGDRYVQMAKDFDSIRKDVKRLVTQIEDGKQSIGDRLQNSWMVVTRGPVNKRFNRIRANAIEIHRSSEDVMARLRAILTGYGEARMGLQEARILTDGIRKKAKAAWEAAQNDLEAKNQELTRLTSEGDDTAKNHALLQRDEAIREAREAERRYQIAEDLYNNLSIAYEAGDSIMTRIAQTADVQERVWSQSVTFFGTNEVVLTALSASFTGLKSLHETTQGHEVMKDGINEAIGDLATTGTTIMEAGVRAGYGPTIKAEQVKKLVDSIVSFQERSAEIKDEMRALTTKNEQEMREVTEDGRQRLTKLLTAPPRSSVLSSNEG